MAMQISPVDVNARKNLDLRAGDTVRVHQKIEEKGKYRIQLFEGLVLARKHGTEAGGTFTVRRVLSGVGVEKVFPLYSPMIDKIEIVKRSRVRRAKLYYIREKVAREARRQLRRSRVIGTSDVTEQETVPADFANETEAQKEEIVEEMTAPTDEKGEAAGEKAE
jgi:large subunit ribosomal protein L19